MVRASALNRVTNLCGVVWNGKATKGKSRPRNRLEKTLPRGLKLSLIANDFTCILHQNANLDKFLMRVDANAVRVECLNFDVRGVTK